jgi:hypothetical protein
VNVTFLLGCLAPGWVIDTSYRFAYWGAALSGAAALASFLVEWRRRRFSWLPIYALLLLPHPGWPLGWREIRDHVRAVSSDCGYSDRFVSMALLSATVSVLLIVLFRPRMSRRLFLVVLAASGWVLHAGTFAFFRPPLLLASWFPASISGSRFAEEVVPAIVFGEMQLLRCTICLTFVCAALYIPWHYLRRQNAA